MTDVPSQRVVNASTISLLGPVLPSLDEGCFYFVCISSVAEITVEPFAILWIHSAATSWGCEYLQISTFTGLFVVAVASCFDRDDLGQPIP